MTYVNYIFRSNAQTEDAVTKYPSPTGFSVANNTGYKSVAAGGKGYGMSSSAGAFAYDQAAGIAASPLLAGAFTSTGTFRIDAANGRYNIRAALGSTQAASTVSMLIYDGDPANGLLVVPEITSGTTSVGTNQVLDIDGTVKIFSDWLAGPANLTLSAPITSGYLTLVKGGNAWWPRNIGLEPISDPLADAFSDSDDTGATFNRQFTTFAGSDLMLFSGSTSIVSPITVPADTRLGLVGGMYVSGSTVPAGRTIKGFEVSRLKNGGTGHAVGDVVSFGSNTIRVDVVDGNGAIREVRRRYQPSGQVMIYGYTATTTPTTLTADMAQTSTTGSGTGAVFDIIPPYKVLSLNSGTGVTAGTSIPFKFGKVQPSLYDKMPAGSPLMPVKVLYGDATNLSVLALDGSPSPYLTIGQVKSKNFIIYTGVPFSAYSGSGADQYVFRVQQVDTSGTFTGSPRLTTFTIPIVRAPTKPTGNPLTMGYQDALDSMLDTRLYLERKRRDDFITANKWPEWKGQPFTAFKYAKTLTEVGTRLNELQTGWVPGTWAVVYLIDTNFPGENGVLASAGTGADWASAGNGITAKNFLSTATTSDQYVTGAATDTMNGGVVVRPHTSFASLIYGKMTFSNLRGVQFDNWPAWWLKAAVANTNNNINKEVMLTVNTDATKPLTMVNITNMKVGRYHDPAENPANVLLDVFGGATQPSPPGVSPFAGYCFSFNNISDQVRIINCDFFGGFWVVMQIVGCRIYEEIGTRFRLMFDDFHSCSSATVVSGLSSGGLSRYKGALYSDDLDQYHAFRNVTCWWHHDGYTLINPQTYTADGVQRTAAQAPPNGNNLFVTQHQDFIQCNTASGNTDGGSTYFRTIENVVITTEMRGVGFDPNNPGPGYTVDRQFFIATDNEDHNNLVVNCSVGSNTPRGVELSHGTAWVAFCTFAPAPVQPKSIANYNTGGAVIQNAGQSHIYNNGATNGGRRCTGRVMNTLALTVDESDYGGVFAWNCAQINWKDSTTYQDAGSAANPNTYLTGPFTPDPIDAGQTTSVRYAYAWSGGNTDDYKDHRKNLWKALAPKSNVGAQHMQIHVGPGASDPRVTRAEAQSARLLTQGELVGSGVGPVQFRWSRNASNSGPVDGSDVKLNVG